MNYQDWKDEYHDELISNWKDSNTEKSFDNLLPKSMERTRR